MPNENNKKKMIEIKDVTVSFKQKKKQITAVEDVNLDVAEGEIIGIIGLSGAGKSTLLRTINGLQATSKGSVNVDGHLVQELKEKDLRALRSNIGMIFQHFNLVKSKDVYSNIEFVLTENGKSKEEAQKRVEELLDYVGLADRKHAFPEQLSGGQKQRVAIARALANHTKILLCDEPTSALDAETTESVLKLIKQINREFHITTVLITHELDVVKKICDRVVVMDAGRIVEEGEVYEVFSKPQTSFTENLIKNDKQFKIPEHVLEHVKGKIVRIDYFEENAERALITDVVEKYGVTVNILHGQIEFIHEKPLGILYISVDGDTDQVRDALKYIDQSAGKMEVIQRAV